MRANKRLQQSLDRQLQFLHSRRRSVLWRCVTGLMLGGRLWLSALGRSLPGNTSDKHRIKAADRFLGNKAIHAALPSIYAAVASWLVRHAPSVVVAVDWSGVGARHYMLSAGICHRGRTVPILSRVYPKKLANNQAVQRQFLIELAEVLPKTCTPIIVTDAGFHLPWFDTIRELGWHYVGRVRNATKVLHKGRWKSLRSIRKTAGNRDRGLGVVSIRKKAPRNHRLILAKTPRLKGRKRKTRSGAVGQRKDDRKRSKAAREPWTLATSLLSRPSAVVAVYALRMQIEQTFRDLKNRRNGWALSDVRTRSAQRIEMLLLCAAIADLGLRVVGTAAETAQLNFAFQANTVKDRRVLSLYALARLVLQRSQLPKQTQLSQAARDIHRQVAELSPAKA